MNKQDKRLLLKVICAMLPYGLKATTTSNGWNDIYTITGYNNDRIYLDCPIYDEGDDEWLVESVVPYLRPISSMTEEEQKKFDNFCVIDEEAWNGNGIIGYINQSKIMSNAIDWLNAHHFDYRGLIEKDLALEAPEGMYEF